MKKYALFILAVIGSLHMMGQQVFSIKQGDNGLWGVVGNNTGTTIIPFQYEEFGVKELGKNQATIPAKKNGLWGIIDIAGGIIIPFRYEEFGIKKELFFYSYFDKGEAAIPAKENGKWGFIDLMGNIVVPFDFDDASCFSGLRAKSQAKVCMNGLWGAIDICGNFVVPVSKKNHFDVPDKSKNLEKNNGNGLYNSKKQQLTQAKQECDKLLQEHVRLFVEKRDGFESFAKNYVQNKISEWQKKDEFEKTTDWQDRVNEASRKEKVIQFLKDAEIEYIVINGKNLTLELDTYDADNQTYLIKSKDYGNLLVEVPYDEAQFFKTNWNNFTKNPKYFIENDQLALVEINFTTDNGKSYKYSNEASLNYSSVNIDYNKFAPIGDIPIAGNPNNPPKGTQTVTNVNINIGNSDVDVNIPTGKTVNEKTFAVIIANENYQRESQVIFAKNDGETFKKYCIQTLRLPEKNVHFIADATLNNIRGEINWISQVAKSFNGEASLIFYYAGHGIPDESSKTAYLLPIDGYGSDVETGYKLDDLYAKLGSLPTKSINVFMDACFSGAQRSGDMLAAARGVAIKTSQGKPTGNMVVFSAAQGDETAYPYKEKGHGMFTYFLLKKLQETKGDVTLGELSNYITNNVSQRSIVENNKSQTPTVTPSATLSDKWQGMKLK